MENGFSWDAIIGPPIPTNPSRDEEKQPTAERDRARVMGVEICSRYQKHHELELMAAVVAGMPADMRRLIRSIWCDSKQEVQFTVKMKPGRDFPKYTQPVAKVIGALLTTLHRGHNGVFVGRDGVADPDWLDDDITTL